MDPKHPDAAHRHEKYDRLIARCKSIPPAPTAVAHPCDESSLRGAVDAAQAGLIVPILVGPRARIEAVAGQSGIDISGLKIVDAPHSEASAAAAAALCKMADRKQITGGLLDGPLALDNAISEEAARIKKIDSPVAGRANVLVVPDLEAGNMLAKSLSFLAGADAAGIVLGARVPIILTSRADSLSTRLASCAAVALVANARRANAGKALV